MNYQKIAEDFARTKIPELMELSFGCALKHPQRGLWVMTGFYHVEPSATDSAFSINATNGTHFLRNADSTDFEIIGHPIQLQHWLRAMSKQVHDIDPFTHYGPDIMTISAGEIEINFNLHTGQPATEADYKALCEVLGLV